MCVLSAAEAGFDTVLYVDRPQSISHARLRVLDWREVDLRWSPDDVKLKRRDLPYYAGFADLFRYSLLTQTDGWWFDCDTLILRPAQHFASLLVPDSVVLGYEDDRVVNNAVIGSCNRSAMRVVYETALPYYPVFEAWGITGPRLVTRLVENGELSASIQCPSIFYPVHHNNISRIYLPEDRDALVAEEPGWYCLSLWGEVLSRSGLKYLAPPPGSYLADLLSRNPVLGKISGDPAGMAAYLAQNLKRLDDMNSGRLALATLGRKLAEKLKFGKP
jgi:hypothetical protein